MLLLKRNAPDHVVKHLTERQSALLKAKDLPRDRAFIRQRILSEFYLKNWVRCDCKTDGPIMAIRHNSGGDFSLTTIHTYGVHADNCPLFAESVQLKPKPIDLQQPEDQFNFHRKVRPPQSSRNPSTSSNASSVRQNTLYRLLATLMEKSGLSTLDNDLTFRDCMERINDAACSIKLANKPLNDHLFFGFEKFHQVKSHIANQNVKSWGKSLPHAILIDVVDEVSRDGDDFLLNKVFSKSKSTSFTLYGRSTTTYLHSGRISLRKGPFIVIATIGESSSEKGTSFVAPLRAYIAPVLSKSNWVVVDSNYERVVARQMLSAKIWYRDNTDLIITASKPLFYIDTDIEPCLPDFIVGSDSLAIVLEVMGSHSKDYLARKKRTHESMETLGKLIEFDAYLAETSNDLDKQCFETVKSIFNLLKRHSDSNQ